MKLNLPNRVLLGTLPLLASMPLVANAQTNGFHYPQPNQKGDYISILSTFENGHKSPHLVWKVVSSELNCRSQAGSNSRVIKLLLQNDNVSIVGNPKIYRDRQAKPWFYVAGSGSAEDVKIRCFVRANSQFIEPIPYSIY
ncbi:hypothetical protein [Calothrix sp. PCC 7507]|uniref:hypothetical protein n=1 Tax=Calothrix sp. PCC 7507 TaxID=99598 RepID=UPI00029EF22D|nr:hypothetical protein [Calothrix sp. PCC 7507]AFY31171.1 hypothetical protein Cal7507_0682 [Calothrix sp. PCC 7507]